MRTIEHSSAFKRDFKKVSLTPRYRKRLHALLTDVLGRLVQDVPLDENLSDHALTGDWASYRECHLKPDLLLIYSKPDVGTLRLARLGSHSELFG
ncbi:MAG: type II toxin-antitoxin system YafQ family toxin [Polaromonas sp.]|jgi:mRNA interferase YafQ|nr:type II toxin-antitoxin system YafQ family toxin [Polaromonas sp.]